jgi:sterol desaturase/sphingolipid hydroxylase (fatty acid hydroxylase superfamily)
MQNETMIRLGVFLGLFALFAALEWVAPRRARRHGLTRLATNAAIMVLGAVLLRVLAVALPLLAVGAALDAGRIGWGVFNLLGWNPWVEGLLAILILDLAIWTQHLVTHKVPLFWRFHRVHHADGDFDVTTAIRFHPIEIAASMLLKIALVYLIGPSAVAVIIFEVLLNGTALFNHANIALPLWADRITRKLLVTPDMHRVHHSVDRIEHNSNFGFALSIWDRIFGTYRAQPVQGHDNMTIGLDWQDDRPTRLVWSLLLPFRRT